jgi:hypothetical protein
MQVIAHKLRENVLTCNVEAAVVLLPPLERNLLADGLQELVELDAAHV